MGGRVEETQPTSRETVRVLAALSDENRFRIVELLASDGELSCGAIGKALDISPSLLSHHLAILGEAGIIGRRKNGLWTMNTLQRGVIARQVRTLQSLIGFSGPGPVIDAVIRLSENGGNGHVPGAGGLDGALSVEDAPPPGDEAIAGS
jgi:ArsR family transcriptional regulator